jgi:cell division transport system permease protein
MHYHWKELAKRIFNTGWLNFKRNSYLSFGTTGVMTLVLLIFAGLISLNYLSNKVVEGLQNKVDVSVYFKSDSTEEEVLRIKQDLRNNALVKEVTYISKEQALEDFKKRHAGDPLIQESLDELGENPLQASLNVKAKDPQKFGEIVKFLEANKFRSFIDKINYYENEEVIRRVQGISGGIKGWGLLAMLILASVAVLVTFNTIRLTIYNQRQEIEIMRLVGGSNWHVRAPFMIEGGIYGVFSAGIALLIFYPLAYFLSPKISVLIPGVSLIRYFGVNFLPFAGLILLLGVLLGVVSSAIAIRRFLKI